MKRVAALVKDLFFAAKLEVLLAGCGVPADVVLADAEGVAGLQASPPELLVLDLGVPEALRGEVLAWAPVRLPVIAFGSHVDIPQLDGARAAGCAAVTTNGALERELPGLLRAHLPPVRS